LPWRLGLAAILVGVANGLVLLQLALHGVSLPASVVVSRLAISIVLELILMLAVGPIVQRLSTGGEGILSMASREHR
jgi:hypothetical protein